MEQLLKMVLGVLTNAVNTAKSYIPSLPKHWTSFLPSIPTYFVTSSRWPLLPYKNSSTFRARKREGNVFHVSFVLLGRDGLTTDDSLYACGAGETTVLYAMKSSLPSKERHVSWQALLRQLTHQLKIHPALWSESSKWGMEISKVHRPSPCPCGIAHRNMFFRNRASPGLCDSNNQVSITSPGRPIQS